MFFVLFYKYKDYILIYTFMRRIKLFEDFKSDNFVNDEVGNLLRPLRGFYFRYDVKSGGGRLVITLSKKDPEGIEVFHSDDVMGVLSDVGSFLTWGESWVLDTISYNGIGGSGNLDNLVGLKSVGGLLSLEIIYMK